VSLSTGESLWTHAEDDGDRLWEATLGDLLRAAAAEHPDRVAPSRARASAWLRPWPLAAPVTSATFPATRPPISLPPPI
jgi:hypothetical protein